MKKFLLFVLALLISVGTVVAAPAPKFKKVKLNKYAYYEGMAVKKTPQGQGTLYPCSRCTVKGEFYNNKITNGEISFTEHNIIITGEFTLVVTADKQVMVIVNRGKIQPKSRKGGHKLRKDTQIKFTDDNFTFEDYFTEYPRMPKWYYQTLKQFAGAQKFGRKTDGLAKNIYNNETCTREIVKKATYMKVTFKNGTTARYEADGKFCKWVRANGDFIEFTLTQGEEYKIDSYKITVGGTTITQKDITHTFENGNKYVGTVKKGALSAYVGTNNLDNLISFKGLTWEWDNFADIAFNGTVIYKDGNSEKFVEGISEAEFERREAERKAKEEAERKAKEEAERKAREEAERKAREEAERKAKEEAERQAKVAKFKAARAKDTVEYGTGLYYGEYIAKCTITYMDGVFTCSLVDRVCEYTYENGDKLVLENTYLKKKKYEELVSSEVIPIKDLYSCEEVGKRVLENGKLIVDVQSNDGCVRVQTTKDSKGNYVEYYGSEKGQPLELLAFKHTFTNHPQYKSVEYENNYYTIVFKNGNEYIGTAYSAEYNENAKSSLSNNAHIKKFGITFDKTPASLSEVSLREGKMYNAAGKLIAVYEYGNADPEKLKNAQLEEKVKQLGEKYGHGYFSDNIYYAGNYPSRWILKWYIGTPIEIIKALWGNNSLRLVWSKTVGGVKEEKYRFYVGNGDIDVMLYFANGKLKDY